MNAFIPVFTSNVEVLSLLMLEGADRVRVVTSETFTAIHIQAGKSLADRRLIDRCWYNGVDDSLDVTHTESGTGAVTETITGKTIDFTGIESLAVEGNGIEDRLSVADTGIDDQLFLGAGQDGDRITGSSITPIDVLGFVRPNHRGLGRRTGNDQLTADLARLRSAGSYAVTADALSSIS